MESFATSFEECLEPIVLNNQDVETAWGALRGIVYNTHRACIEPTYRQHKGWFDGNYDEIMRFLEDKHHVYKAYLDDPTSVAKKDVLRIMHGTFN